MGFDKSILNDVLPEIRGEILKQVDYYTADENIKKALEILIENQTERHEEGVELLQRFLTDARGAIHLFIFQPATSDLLTADQKAIILDYLNQQVYRFQQGLATYIAVNDYLAKVILENGYSGQIAATNIGVNESFRFIPIVLEMIENIIQYSKGKGHIKLPPDLIDSSPNATIDDVVNLVKSEKERLMIFPTDIPLDEIVRKFILHFYWLKCCQKADRKIAEKFGLETLLQRKTRNQLKNWIKMFSSFQKQLNAFRGEFEHHGGLVFVRIPKPNEKDIDELILQISNHVKVIIGEPVRIRIVNGNFDVRPILADNVDSRSGDSEKG